MNNSKYEQGEIISNDNVKHLLGYFFVVAGFALALFVLYHLIFDSRYLHHFYLLYIGIGAIVSILSGVFILHKSQ